MNTVGTVLLADDEDLFRHSSAELLRNDGFACDCAENSRQAIELLGKNRYDVLIADICMEGNHDLALVRDSGRIVPGLPVILVTGHPSLETAIPSIELAVMAYLRKPVNYSEIRAQVRLATEQSTLHRAMSEIQQRLRRCGGVFRASGPIVTALGPRGNCPSFPDSRRVNGADKAPAFTRFTGMPGWQPGDLPSLGLQEPPNVRGCDRRND